MLSERGIQLSREQVYRLVTKTPQRLSLDVLSALCDALDCTKDELITTERHEVAPRKEFIERSKSPIGDLRPPRALVRKPRQ